MASINEIKNYIDILFEKSINEYKKLNKSTSMNHIPRDKLANTVINKHLSSLLKTVSLKEGEMLLITKEVSNKLIKN